MKRRWIEYTANWLRKMPEHARPWRYREKAVRYLEKALTVFQKQVGDK